MLGSQEQMSITYILLAFGYFTKTLSLGHIIIVMYGDSFYSELREHRLLIVSYHTSSPSSGEREFLSKYIITQNKHYVSQLPYAMCSHLAKL